MDFLTTLSENSSFLTQAYGGNFQPLFLVLAILATVDLILKGFALWRAARMKMMWWFIALLIVNSLGILPVIFLLFTNSQYSKLGKETKTAASVLMK